MRSRKKEENSRSFWQWLNELSNKHRIAFTIFYSALGLWYSLILTYFGEALNLYSVVENKKQLTFWGIFLTILVFVFIVLKAVSDKVCGTDEEKEKLIASNSLLFQVQSNTAHINEIEEKVRIKAIQDSINVGKYVEPIVNPCERISNIIEGMRIPIAKLISDKSRRFDNDLYISLMYNFPKENEAVWKWGDTLRQKGLAIDEVAHDKSSTFYHLLFSETTPITRVFYNSKQKALLAGRYKKDTEDLVDGKTNEISGSIVCYSIEVKLQDSVFVRAAVGISSYKNRFIPDSKLPKGWENSDLDKCSLIQNIDYIVEQYLSMLRIELCEYYLLFLQKKNLCSANNGLLESGTQNTSLKN